MYCQDDWPTMPDGGDFNGKQLFALLRNGNSPFHGAWDVNLLIREIEESLDTQVVDIPFVFNSSNNYGFHFELANRPDIIARLARGDMNMPNFDGFAISWQALEVKFEAATYKLLCSEPNILASSLIYHRVPISLLSQAAHIRASTFNFNLSLDFATEWLRERLFEQNPESLPLPVAPTRDFCVALFTSKIEATSKNIGDMIGWEDDHETVGPIATAAKQSLSRFIPHLLPADVDHAALYRLVLKHGDFGIHNMTIVTKSEDEPRVTSLFDWETGSIVSAILSDPLMAVLVDLVTDENAAPSVIRVPDEATTEERTDHMMWSKQYFKVLFDEAPDYEYIIRGRKDARHLWFALREWRGNDPEGYFGELSAWAEGRLKELGH